MEKSKQISNKELKKKKKKRKSQGWGYENQRGPSRGPRGNIYMCELTLSLAKSESITFCLFVSNSELYFHPAIYCADL